MAAVLNALGGDEAWEASLLLALGLLGALVCLWTAPVLAASAWV